MKLIDVPIDRLAISSDLSRSRTSKVFEEHLRLSIDEMGLAEPLKVAAMPSGDYLVIDGQFRLRAIQKLRESDESRFATVPAYVVDYAQRFEIRYQTDIYQDLLPSQLAALVEHLHQAENVRKVDIARYIGVSPATLRNYTGLWRLIQRGGLFSRIVDLMDVGVMPSSNPYAWLRLTPEGLEFALESEFTGGESAYDWIEARIARARHGDVAPFQLKAVEAATNALPADCYREDEEVRNLKRELGLRRAASSEGPPGFDFDASKAIDHLLSVSKRSEEPVIQVAAEALAGYLR
jgi:hypothetical protein